MHHVSLDEQTPLGEETSKKLHSNLPPGGWFPALRDLSWCITELNIPYADLFLSPHLQSISIGASWSWTNTVFSRAILQTLASIISALPASSLERLFVENSDLKIPWARFKDSFSSVILRCGPSFTEYDSPVPLSNAAMVHLIRLPHLHTLRIHGPPPTYPTSSVPLAFPPLKELTLGEGAACGWFSLLRGLEDGASTTQGVTPLSKAKESLTILNVEDMPGFNIDPSSVSTVHYFRNLVDLNVGVFCPDEDERGQCIFKLNSDNVTELAMALTQVESLILGHPCTKNTCLTTVACFLPISAHCSELQELEIHFNTANLVDDLKNTLEDPRFQQLRSLPRCPLAGLNVFRMPLSLDESDIETVAKAMIDIFPSLKYCEERERGWEQLSLEIAYLQQHLE